MAFELEALVGHLYMVDGRAINTTPPGALIEVAPKDAVHGRRIETFFTLVLPSGQNMPPISFYERMAALSAERYFAKSGSVTAALRSVFGALNHNLYEHNAAGYPYYEANMVCCVLRNTEIYIARVGAGIAILQHNGEVIPYPQRLHEQSAVYSTPLGARPEVDIRMTRFEVISGSRLILADASIVGMPPNRLELALRAENLEKALDDFQGWVQGNSQLMAIEFVPADQSADIPVVSGEVSTEISAEIAAARSRRRSRKPDNSGDLAGEEKRETPEVLDRAATYVLRAFNGGTVLVARSLSAVGRLVEQSAPGSADEYRGGVLNRLIAAVVVAIPLLMVGLVVFTWVGDVGSTEFEQCVQRAAEARDTAHRIDSSNVRSLVNALEGVLQIAAICETLHSGDEALGQIKREAQEGLDALTNIKRREATVVASVPGARLSKLVLQGLDIYALDEANSRVYRFTVTSDGHGTTSLGQPLTRMRKDVRLDGFEIGAIIDIDFDKSQNLIIALDENGVLLRCPPNFPNQCNAQQLPDTNIWVDPIAISMWQGRVYVMDPGLGQILRYDPSGRDYVTPAKEYFTKEYRPNLASGAIDFDITDDGRIFILYDFGSIEVFFGAELQPFNFSSFLVEQIIENRTALQSMYLSNVPEGVFLVSRSNRTVYETTWAGTFQGSYRVFDEEKFDLITDVVAVPTNELSRQIVYVASGNTIFSFKKEA